MKAPDEVFLKLIDYRTSAVYELAKFTVYQGFVL